MMKSIKSKANLIYKDMEELYPYEMEHFGIIEDYMMLGYDIEKAHISTIIDTIRSTSDGINDGLYTTILDNFEDLVVSYAMSKMGDTHRIVKQTNFPNDNTLSVIKKTIIMYRIPDLSGDVAIGISLEFGCNINRSGAMKIARSIEDDYDSIALIELGISNNFVKVQETICEYLKKFFKVNEVYIKPILNCKQTPEEKHQETIDKYIEELSYYMIAFYILNYIHKVEEFLKGRV